MGDVGDRLSSWGALEEEEDMNVLLCLWSQSNWYLLAPCFSTRVKHVLFHHHAGR